MKARIKVLSVLNEIGWGGDESRLLSMAAGLDSSRFEHLVITLLDHGSEMQHAGLPDREKQYRDMGVVVKSLSKEEPDTITRSKPANGLQRKLAVFRRARRLARIIRRWKIDVIDARTAAYLVAAVAGKMTRTPTLITWYGLWDEDTISWTWPVTTSLLLADGILTDSEVRASQFRAHLHAGQGKVSVIPNGIPQPSSAYNRCESRKLFGFPDDPALRIIGQVARLIDYKGQHVLLRAAPKVLAQCPDAAFLLVGYTLNEDYQEELERLAQELGIGDRVRIVSYPGRIGDVWSAIDIHVHPSLFDSQPIAIIEGMSLGKPAVVTSAGGIPEMVEHGRTGLVVPPGDPMALANAILQLLESPQLAGRLGEAARQRYEERYRPETMISALENIFVRMAN